ncbi:MAG TPA: gliding motility-associated C-terminal domain-containing protein [Flavipsychrobacter sp.]|nr:gliding motility-associated C-terminal domain-containing protein [Flavipsychrobacter sp.]
MNVKIYSFLFCCLALCFSGNAHDTTISVSKNQLSFIKNEGQWTEQIHYKAFLPGGAVFLTPEGFMYNFYAKERLHQLHDIRLKEQRNISKETVQMHAYSVKWIGGNTHAKRVEEEQRATYHNYFIGKDEKNWKGAIPLFGKLTYQNVYPDIDLTVYNADNNLKYDFVLKPGAKVQDIILEFEGVVPVITNSGALKLVTIVGDIIESAPYTYQLIDGKKRLVDSRYKKQRDNTISFELGLYDESYPVIIDPSLVFATYSGSSATTFGFSATYNNQGDLIEAGECFGVGWPVKTGAYQTTFGGQVDLGINCFNASGTTLLHSTYLGGNDLDQPVSLICDQNMDLYIMAVTESTNFPVSSGAYDKNYNGNMDYAVIHLNNTYTTLIGSTLIGGSDMDGSTNPKGEIYLDKKNNIYITGYTKSPDYPVTPGAVQATLSGISDGAVSIVNNTCSHLLSSTYLGGSRNERLTGIRKMPNDNIVVSGTTESMDYPTTPGVFQPISNNSGVKSKGVISVLTADLTGFVASTYVQAPDTGSSTFLQFVDYDRQNSIYVYGSTDTSFPVTPGKYTNAGSKTLLAKFSPTLNSLTWATRIGSSANSATAIIPTAFLADNCGKMYLAGYAGGMPGYPLTPNAISTNPVGFWIGILDVNATSFLFGTFFGSQADHLDGGTSRFDKKGVIYHAVCCGNTVFPTTSTAAFPNRSATATFDIVGYKLDGETQSVVAVNAATPGTTSCSVPFTVNFQNYSQNATSYFWDFKDGNTSAAANPTHTFTTAGTYNVMLVAINSLTCNLYDTIYLPIHILNSNFNVPDIDTSICFQNGILPVQLTLPPPSGSTNLYYSWLPHPAITGATNTSAILVDLTIDTIFKVVVTDSIPNACSVKDTATITVHVIDKSRFYALPDTIILFCPGQQFELSATGDQYTTYSWSDLSGLNTIFNASTATPYIIPQQTTDYVVHIYSRNRTCFVTDTVRAAVKPVINLFPVTPVYICLYDTIQLQVTTDLDPSSYNVSWRDISGEAPKDMLSGETSLTPFVNPKESRRYVVEVSMQHAGFCRGQDTVDVFLHPKASIDAGEDELIKYGEPIQLHARGNGKFLWLPNQYLTNNTIADPFSSPPDSIKYYLTVTTAEGCEETDSVSVRVTHLTFPSGFTPNGDGLNDELRLIVMNDRVELEQLLIMNRWGQKVFKTNDLRKGWNGYYNGTYAEGGVYFYQIKYKIGKKSYFDKGDVTLIR